MLLEIRQNLVIPITQKKFITDENISNKLCPFKLKWVNNKLNNSKYNEMKQKIIDDKINNLNLKIYGEIMELKDCCLKICNKINDESNSIRSIVSKQIKLVDIDYDLTNCTYLLCKDMDIDTKVGKIINQKEEYFNKENKVNKHLKNFIKKNPVCNKNVLEPEESSQLSSIIKSLTGIISSLTKIVGTTNAPKKSKIPILEQFTKENLIIDNPEKIIEHKDNISKILNDLCKGINYDNMNRKDYSVVEFIYDNYCIFYYILLINIYLSHLDNLCKYYTKGIYCNVILEINQMLEIDIQTQKNYLLGVTEIIMAINIKTEQWNKFFEIMNNFNNRASKKRKVHHFMMGKGKSSVITPLLTISNIEYIINIIVPTNLIKQTQETMKEFDKYYNLQLIISDDATLKEKYLMNTIEKENNIYLIDEFDYMCEPLRSNFNMVIESTNFYDEIILNELLKVVDDYHNDKPLTLTTDYSYINEAIQTLNNKNFIKNVTYGMSHSNYKIPYCIPYMRKDTPLENSSFKSNIITITLTIKYFYENNFILKIRDIKYILYKNDQFLLDKLSEYYSTPINNLTFNFIRESNFIEKFVHSENIQKRKEIFNFYVKLIMKSMTETSKIMNTSFYDIMNLDCEWQIGYSGNVNIIIPPYKNICKYSTKIKKDYEEILGSYFAISGNYPNSKNNIFKINSIDDIKLIFNTDKYNVLIDACAFLVQYNNKDIAKLISEIKNKSVIYLDSKNTKMIYHNNKHNIYNEVKYRDLIQDGTNLIYYYSQQHIIGIDFKQPNILNGLVLINDKNNYTEVVQAIYRMRKLNRGHVSHIGYCGNNRDIISNIKSPIDIENLEIIHDDISSKTAKNNLYSNLVNNDLRHLENTKNVSQFLMFKFFYRKYITNNYQETFLTPLYKIENNREYIYSIIIKYFTQNYISQEFNYDEIYDINDYKNLIDTIGESICTIIKEKKYTNPAKIMKDVIKLLNNIKLFELSDLLNVIYGINDKLETDTIIDTEINIQQEKEVNIQQEIIKSYQGDKIDMLNKINISIFSNPYNLHNLILYCVYMQIIDDKDLYFSYNLYTITKLYNICIVRFSETIFLLENISYSFIYYNFLPIYSADGFLLNDKFVPIENILIQMICHLIKLIYKKY